MVERRECIAYRDAGYSISTTSCRSFGSAFIYNSRSLIETFLSYSAGVNWLGRSIVRMTSLVGINLLQNVSRCCLAGTSESVLWMHI